MTKRNPLSKPGIYRITSKSDGKVYVGQAKKVWLRWTLHLSDLRRKVHKNSDLQADWDRLGPDNFIWELAAEPPVGWTAADLTRMEIEEMQKHALRYNLMIPIQVYLGASASTREKLSQINAERWADPEYQKRQQISRRARMDTPEYRANLSAAMQTYNATPEAAKIHKEAAAKRWAKDGKREAMGAKTKAHWEDPMHRAKQAAARKAVWQDPEKRARRVAGLKASWDRLTPEERAERQAKMRAGKK